MICVQTLPECIGVGVDLVTLKYTSSSSFAPPRFPFVCCICVLLVQKDAAAVVAAAAAGQQEPHEETLGGASLQRERNTFTTAGGAGSGVEVAVDVAAPAGTGLGEGGLSCVPHSAESKGTVEGEGEGGKDRHGGEGAQTSMLTPTRRTPNEGEAEAGEVESPQTPALAEWEISKVNYRRLFVVVCAWFLAIFGVVVHHLLRIEKWMAPITRGCETVNYFSYRKKYSPCRLSSCLFLSFF